MYSQLKNRETGLLTPSSVLKTAKGSRYFVERLGKWHVLTGHDGCVNTIAWNESGDTILSGSDDCHLNIYQVGRNKPLQSIRSGHRANIFSAKFLPATSDKKIVSCCGGGMVHYNDIGSDTYYGQNYFNCHAGTTYELTVIPGDPNSFMTCGEDGTVRHFDLRVKTNCYCQECRDDILIERQHAITSVTVNPMTPYHIAVGCEDSFVRVYDMRAICAAKEKSSMTTRSKSKSGMLACFKPPQLKASSCRVTSLRYGETGEDILASYCTDYVYLFSLHNKAKRFDTKSPEKPHVASEVDQDEPVTQSIPPVKRLRLRGDWSDTGPNARPEVEQESQESNSGTLMQRISDVFSNWLEEAFNEGVRGTSHSEPNDEGNSQSEPDEDSNPELPNPESNVFSNGRSTPTALLSVHSGGTATPDSDIVDPCVETKLDEVMEESFTGNNLGTVECIEKITEGLQSNLIGSEAPSTRGRESESEISPDVETQEPGSSEDLGSHEREIVAGSLPRVADGKRDVNSSKPTFDMSSNMDDFIAKQGHKQSYIPCDSETNDDSGTSYSNVQCQSEIGKICVLGLQSGNDKTDSNSIFENETDKQTSCGPKNLDDNTDKSEEDLKSQNTSYGNEDANRGSRDYRTSMASSSIVANKNDCSDQALQGTAANNHKASSYELDPVGSATIKSTFVNNQIAQYLADSASEKCSQTKKGVSVRENRGGDASEKSSPDLNKTYEDTDRPELTESKCCILNHATSAEIKHDSDDKQNEPKRDFCATDHTVKSRLRPSEDNIFSKGSPINDNENELRESVVEESSSKLPRRAPSSNEDSTRLRTTINDGELQTCTSRRSSVSSRRISPSFDSSRMRTGSSTSSDDAASRREAAATRIQRCFRLQKKHAEQFSSFDDDADNDEDNVLVPRLLSSYKGHRNARTMIKEANFWSDDFVLSGSDCGRVFIWDRHTSELVTLLEGDKHVVNCVQPHPFDPILATSGIDYDIKVWAPVLQEAVTLNGVDEIIYRNEQMLEESRDTITVPASFMLRMLASLSRVRGRRRRQRQGDHDNSDGSDDE